MPCERATVGSLPGGARLRFPRHRERGHGQRGRGASELPAPRLSRPLDAILCNRSSGYEQSVNDRVGACWMEVGMSGLPGVLRPAGVARVRALPVGGAGSKRRATSGRRDRRPPGPRVPATAELRGHLDQQAQVVGRDPHLAPDGCCRALVDASGGRPGAGAALELDIAERPPRVSGEAGGDRPSRGGPCRAEAGQTAVPACCGTAGQACSRNVSGGGSVLRWPTKVSSSAGPPPLAPAASGRSGRMLQTPSLRGATWRSSTMRSAALGARSVQTKSRFGSTAAPSWVRRAPGRGCGRPGTRPRER